MTDPIADAPDAITLLTDDHRNVERLFEQYESLVESGAPAGEREALAATICAELAIHTRLEEEIFYPAVRETLGDALIDEAIVEHASAKDLMAQLAEMSGDEELYDAKVKVLAEQIEHHVEEEEREMFPEVRSEDIDIDELGAAMAALRQQLVDEIGLQQAA